MKTKDIVIELDKEAGRQFETCPDIIPNSLLHIAARRIEKLDELVAFLLKLSGLTERDPKEVSGFSRKVLATSG